MSKSAISVEGVSKKFRLYSEKNQYLKTAILRGKRAHYEEFWALKDVSFEVPTGSTYGIIGSNGSGKSTMLKCIAGILRPDLGQITVNGRISALLELGAGFHPEMSGRENVFLNGAILGMTNKDIRAKYDEIVEFAGIEKFIDMPVKNYSSGMTVRLGFAIAINVDPEILIIDEVLAVGDSSFQQRCQEKIEEFRLQGKTIIIVSHGLSDVARLCDTVAWLEKGEVRMEGNGYDVTSDYLASTHNSSLLSTFQSGEHWGSGEIQITGAHIINGDGTICNVVKTNDDVTLRLDYVVNAKTKNVIFGITLRDLHGNEIWGTSTDVRGFLIDELSQSGRLDLVIPALPLLAGTYDVSIEIRDETHVHTFDHWERAVRFEIMPDQFVDTGIVTIRSHFKML